jgi:hypothetical protein
MVLPGASQERHASDTIQSVCLWHVGWRDPAKRIVQYRHYALSHGGFYGKYLRKGDLFILTRAILHFYQGSPALGFQPDQQTLTSIHRDLGMLPGIFGFKIKSPTEPVEIDNCFIQLQYISWHWNYGRIGLPIYLSITRCFND